MSNFPWRTGALCSGASIQDRLLLIKLSGCGRPKPRLRCVYFHSHLPVSCKNCWRDCTDMTADYESASALVQNCGESHPVAVQMCAVKVPGVLELVHPIRGEWLTSIPKLGKTANFWEACAKCFIVVQSHKWKRSKYFLTCRSLCIKSKCQALVASYYCSMCVSKHLILPVVTGLQPGRTHYWNSICSQAKIKICPDQAALQCGHQLSAGLLINRLSKWHYSPKIV